MPSDYYTSKRRSGSGGFGSRQNPQERFDITVAQEKAKQPFDIAAEERKAKSNVANKNFTGEDIRAITLSDSFKKDSQFILDSLKTPNFSKSFAKATMNIPGLTNKRTKGNILGFPTTLGDQGAIDLNRVIGRMGTRITNLFSGAQINENEFNRYMDQIPSGRDLTVPIGEDGVTTYPTIRKSLTDLEMELTQKKDLAIKGGYYNPNSWEDSSDNSSPVPGMNQPNNLDPVEAIKQRFRQRNP